MEKQTKIAIFSPASPPSLEKFQQGIDVLRKNKIPFKSFVDFSDTSPALKAFLLYELITSGEFSFIWAVRGGFGSIKLIPYLEEIFAEKKKINTYANLVGFSDITALHLYFYKKFKKKGLHAPMIVNLPDLSGKAMESLFKVMLENKDIILKGEVYQEGEAEGILIGGNLITLASLCGTPYLPLNEPFILAIEETNEKRYRIERAFLQVIFTLGVNNIKGIVIGDLGGVDPLKFLKEIKDFLPENIPIGYNFPFGHIRDNFPLIIGEEAYLRIKNQKFEFFQRKLSFKNLKFEL